MRAGLRRFVACGAAVLAAAVPAAVVATPAAAIIIPTYGFGWHYDSQTSFTFKAWLPGVELNGSGSDNGTTRTVSGTLADKVVDGFRLRDGRASYGIGLETFALGFPIHFDWAWRTLFNQAWEDVLFEDRGGSSEFRRPRFSVWIGYDF